MTVADVSNLSDFAKAARLYWLNCRGQKKQRSRIHWASVPLSLDRLCCDQTILAMKRLSCCFK